jgi:hypothetical protein
MGHIKRGTSVFTIKGSLSEGCLVGVNVIPGEQTSQSPYHSELGGTAGIVEVL